MSDNFHLGCCLACRAPFLPSTNYFYEEACQAVFYLQNRFLLSERLALTAGLRGEHYHQQRSDRRRTVAQGNAAGSANTEWLPGLGLTFKVHGELQLFASAYQAFSPALNGDALDALTDQQLDAERSVNVELGLRGGNDQLRFEMAWVRMDFDNQIIPANSNSQFQRTTGGATGHQGVELGLEAETRRLLFDQYGLLSTMFTPPNVTFVLPSAPLNPFVNVVKLLKNG